MSVSVQLELAAESVEIEEVRLQKADLKSNGILFDYRLAPSLYAAVFPKYGLDVVALDPSEAARRLREHRRHSAIVAVLRDWVSLAPQGPTGERLRAILELTDKEDTSFWRAWMTALKTKDRAQLRRLAESAEAATLPPASLVHLADDLIEADESALAESLLRKGLDRFPNDFWLNYSMGWALEKSASRQQPDAVAYYLVAAALRPGSPGIHLSLAQAMQAKGDLPGAVKRFQRAIELRPSTVALFGCSGGPRPKNPRNRGLDTAKGSKQVD
jgi:tetratricopeptide (TPR) repeat protein